MEREVFVSLDTAAGPVLVGRLWSRSRRGVETATFQYRPGAGWALSPAYDLNPVPADVKPRVLCTAIDFDDATASLALALQVAPYFELNDGEAWAIVAEVARATAEWRALAAGFGLPATETTRMASAFEHADSRLAASRRA